MSKIDKGSLLLLESYITQIMEHYKGVGLAISVVKKNGETLYENFFGYRDKEAKLKIDQNTIFGIASVTKSFTCLAIMQLAEKGLLSINDPVSKYIPEFANKNQDTIKIVHFMNHSGGFFPLGRLLFSDIATKLGFDPKGNLELAANQDIALEATKIVAERLDNQTVQKGLYGVPGESLSYCNDGFGLLSEIISRVGDCNSFAEYLVKHILKPLGMERSFCDFLKPALDENATTLYKNVNGTTVGHRDFFDYAFALNGGGAMKSTLADLKKYVTMYLNEGKALSNQQIATEYSIREMCKPSLLYRPQSYYGYGLAVTQIDDLTVIEHGGSLPGVSSNIAWCYQADLAVVILCNTSNVPVSLISEAAIKTFSGKPCIKNRDIYKEYSWSEEQIKDALGIYISEEKTQIEIFLKEDNTIGVKIDGKIQKALTINTDTIIIRNLLSDNFAMLYYKNNKAIAIRYGGRLIPKSI